MARKAPPKLDWAQIKSDAVSLPYSPGAEALDLEPKPTERQISFEKIKSIARKTKGQTLSEAEIKLLDVLVNNDLLFYFRSKHARSLTAKQITKSHDNFYSAIKALENYLPESRSPLFWAISDKGDSFANKMGPHPGLAPYKAGVFSPDETGLIAEKWLIFRSEERLDEFCNLV